VIRFSGVAKRYPGGHEALRGITLDIADGEMVAVTGRSGAGKSTLLKLAAGIERATSGTVVVNGQNLGALGDTALAVLRRRVGFVFQDHKLLFDRSCFENVALPLRIAGFARDEAARRVRAALDKVGLLARERATPVALSGGEQQRLCIARAIVNRPMLLIADEPTGNLDPATSVGIMRLLDRINRTGTTVVMASHDAAIVDQMRKRVIELEAGDLVRDQNRGVYGYAR